MCSLLALTPSFVLRGRFSRADIQLQTKIRPTSDREKLRKGINDSLVMLRTEHIDLLALHGINSPEE